MDIDKVLKFMDIEIQDTDKPISDFARMISEFILAHSENELDVLNAIAKFKSFVSSNIRED